MITFLVYISVNWWAIWYPGAEPGGGGFIAQRMFCAKDEKNSLLATLWFNIAHYALRPWPWIVVGLASIILYPDLKDKESGYVLSDGELPAGGAAGIDAGCFRSGVHVDDWDAVELGRQLPGERLLSPVLEGRRATGITCRCRNGHRFADHRFGSRDVLSWIRSPAHGNC